MNPKRNATWSIVGVLDRKYLDLAAAIRKIKTQSVAAFDGEGLEQFRQRLFGHFAENDPGIVARTVAEDQEMGALQDAVVVVILAAIGEKVDVPRPADGAGQPAVGINIDRIGGGRRRWPVKPSVSGPARPRAAR